MEIKKVRFFIFSSSFNSVFYLVIDVIDSKTINSQLKEELHRARQSHSDEVDRLRKEVSKLTDELRQRDLTIDSLKGSLSNITQQLRAELEREKQRAAELQVSETADLSFVKKLKTIVVAMPLFLQTDKNSTDTDTESSP